MSDPLIQYRINTNWRHHVLEYVDRAKGRKREVTKTKSGFLSTLEYCDGNSEYAGALDHWLEFMKEEERFAFYVHFSSASCQDANRSLKLLIDRHESDLLIRMPLLRDAFTCYSRSFKSSRGRLGKTFCLKDDIGTPEPKPIHDKIISDRDQLYAHCDLSAKEPRVSIFGIGLRGAGFNWDDYMKILPDIDCVINSAIKLLDDYIEANGMHDSSVYFSQFETATDLSTKEPILLNKLHGYESNKASNRKP